MKRIAAILVLIFAVVVAHATVTTGNLTVSFTCTGSTGPFPFTFPISDPTALTVTQNGTVLSSSAYTMTPVNNNYSNGGSVTLNSSCPNPQPLVLTRISPVTQTSVFADNMPIPMKTIENGLDKLTEIEQEQSSSLHGLWMLPIYSPTSPSGTCTDPDQVEYVTGNGSPYIQFTCVAGIPPALPQWVQTGGGPTSGTACGGDNTIPNGCTGATTQLGANGTLGIPGPVFNVIGYGAVGDGTTNDCSAITAAEAARDAAGGGILFFPLGQYNVGSSCRLTLSANGAVEGEGNFGIDVSTYQSPTNIISTDTTGVFLTVTAPSFAFLNIGCVNTGTPTSGSCVLVNGSTYLQKVDYWRFSAQGFYDNIDHSVGSAWSMNQSYVGPAVRYGMTIQDTQNQDAGDWSISNSFFNCSENNTEIGCLEILGAGGGKIVGNKFIGNPSSPVTENGIIANSGATGQLDLTANSIEQFDCADVDIVNWSNVNIDNFYMENTGACSNVVGGTVDSFVFQGGSVLQTTHASPDIAIVHWNWIDFWLSS